MDATSFLCFDGISRNNHLLMGNVEKLIKCVLHTLTTKHTLAMVLMIRFYQNQIRERAGHDPPF